MHRAHRARLVLGVLMALSTALITLDVRGDASALRAAGATVAGPAQELLAAAARPLADASGAGEARERVRELERDRARLAAELWSERAARERLAQRERIAAAAPRRALVMAGVVAAGRHQGYGHTITIDAGSADGVRPDMAVISGDGLVGRVVAAGAGSATVLLAADPGASTGVRVSGLGEIGVVTGTGLRGGGPLRLRLLDADARLEAGQRLETFGSAGTRPYPPGIPVGIVERVDPPGDQLTRTALVRPFARFTALDTVAVVTGEARDGD
ncbi:rod shape-determining protein MreC [Bailinhaonella thermotolerans]|uniref:Cell shape-determining protein MreC n=1 Tax=Bailinhaonella thermotolerans TaxID=1070861 RepID=A0A3A4BEH9_9ACTN|nr:rod shape-determining protein MreC [Bailinhaonella thermotolerans]RJL32720.1 rod shape-determining protein MreC [Bailinhaonella thermotolerans]